MEAGEGIASASGTNGIRCASSSSPFCRRRAFRSPPGAATPPSGCYCRDTDAARQQRRDALTPHYPSPSVDSVRYDDSSTTLTSQQVCPPGSASDTAILGEIRFRHRLFQRDLIGRIRGGGVIVYRTPVVLAVFVSVVGIPVVGVSVLDLLVTSVQPLFSLTKRDVVRFHLPRVIILHRVLLSVFIHFSDSR
ncbi:hypothetical protein C8R45DRAFT_1109237 [Mycena sanguinolenta]|nr:hypothetical protein C8R45DRAFT_1109237 [Mycena sanguinolenta]